MPSKKGEETETIAWREDDVPLAVADDVLGELRAHVEQGRLEVLLVALREGDHLADRSMRATSAGRGGGQFQGRRARAGLGRQVCSPRHLGGEGEDRV